MSATYSTKKGVSVEQDVNKIETAVESATVDECSADFPEDGYAYRRVAANQEGLALVEVNADVETAEDVYDKVFEQLGGATASHRSETQIARGVKYDRSLMGVPSAQIAQKKAEMHCMEREGWITRETPRLINGAWGGQVGTVPEGKALETQERIAAREKELQKIRDQTTAGFGQGDRPQRTRGKVVSRRREQKKEREQRVVGSYCEVDDPRQQLGEANPGLLGEVNRSAQKLAEKYDVSRSWIAREIASRVLPSGDVISALFGVKDELLEDETVIRPIAEVDPAADRVSVAGRITTLYYPHSQTQYQVGIIEDDTSAAKVTIWRRSDPRVTLREGDQVAIKRASPGVYRGQKTLAVRHDTLIIVRKAGDGPAKSGCRPGECNPTPQNVDRKRTGGIGEPVPRPAAVRHQQFERTIYTAELVPEKFHDWAHDRPDVGTVRTNSGEKAYAITTRRRFPNYSPGKAKDKERKERSRQRWKSISYEPTWHERIRRVDDENYINRQYLFAGQGWGLLDWDLPWPGHSDEQIPR